MAEQQTKAITIKELRNKFNIIGLAIIFYCALQFLFSYFKVDILMFSSSLLSEFSELAINTGYSIITLFLSLIIPFVVVKFVLKIEMSEIMHFDSIQWFSQIQYTCVSIAIYIFTMFLINVVLSHFAPTFISSFKMNEAFFSNDDIIRIAYSCYFILFLPFLIEFVFRGVILKCFSRFGAKFALIASSFVYMLFNIQSQYFLIYFILGLFFAYISLIHSSFISSYLAHAGLNILIVAMIYIPKNYIWLMGLASIVIYVLAVLTFYNIRSKQSRLNQTLSMKDCRYIMFSSWILVISLVILSLYKFFL